MSIVADVFEAAVDLVGDVVETVGDVVEDVVDVVVDTVEYVVENPEIIVIAVAAPQVLPSIGITGAAVQPVTAGLISASQGGDLEDIGKAALGSFVAPKVGGAVANQVAGATAGSNLQNVLSSAAGSGASAATQAVIQGGDVGKSALIGAAGGAGGALAREAVAGLEYDVPVPSQSAAQIAAQEAGLNSWADLAADIGSSLGRATVTGDVKGEVQRGLEGAINREAADLLRVGFAAFKGSEENAQAEEAIAKAMDENPRFAEELQLAQIAVGDELLTTDEKLDVLAETIARDEFDKVKQTEDVAILPFVAAPIAEVVGANLLRTTAVNAAPNIIRTLATYAAQSPRVAQLMVTNPYVQQTLAAAGLSVTIVGGIGVVGTAYDLLQSDTGAGADSGALIKIEPITSPSMDRLEEARQLRYAADVAETIPNADMNYAAELKTLASNSEQLVQAQDKIASLNSLKSQGFSVGKELQRVEVQAQQLIPLVEAQAEKVNVPIYNVTTIAPGRSPVVPEIFNVPTARATGTRAADTRVPGFAAPTETPTDVPGVTPTDTTTAVPGREVGEVETAVPGTGTQVGTGTQAGTQAGTQTGTQAGTQVGTEAATGELGVPTPGPIAGPIEIEDLFRDEDILNLIREGFGEGFVEGTIEAADLGEAEPDIQAGESAGTPAPTDIRPAVVGKTGTPVSITPRSVSSGTGAITGMKEPTFGGDPGQQQDVWNIRSLRLKKALGL